jgi:hypothetical protein
VSFDQIAREGIPQIVQDTNGAFLAELYVFAHAASVLLAELSQASNIAHLKRSGDEERAGGSATDGGGGGGGGPEPERRTSGSGTQLQWTAQLSSTTMFKLHAALPVRARH